jgi:hypothetical protein
MHRDGERREQDRERNGESERDGGAEDGVSLLIQARAVYTPFSAG